MDNHIALLESRGAIFAVTEFPVEERMKITIFDELLSNEDNKNSSYDLSVQCLSIQLDRITW